MVGVGERRIEDVVVDAVAEKHPGAKEDDEANVARRLVSEVAKHFSQREEDVNHVHNDHNHMADTSQEVLVRANNQGTRHNVVDKHLPVVFAALLNVDDVDLLDPDGKLDQVVCFQWQLYGIHGPVLP